MTQDNPEQRITRLEMLFAEHEYTVETLNDIVTQQSDQLTRMTLQIEQLKQQLKDLREQIPEGPAAGHEIPPHY